MSAAWGPGEDSDDEVEEEDLIQEYGLPAEPMDTSSDDPSQLSISQQQAFEVCHMLALPPARYRSQAQSSVHPQGIRSAWNIPLMAWLSPRGTPCIMQTYNSRTQLQGLLPCASGALSGCVCTHAAHMCSPCLRAVFSCLQRQAITDNPESQRPRR